MDAASKKRLYFISSIYWFLLLYVIAVLVWWFIALEIQNRKMTSYKLNELKLDDPGYQARYDQINEEKRRKTASYIGEGITFLGLTLVGAFFVYRTFRRQLNFQQQQQNFMMTVTHELKTPIAVAKLNLETLQKHSLEESKRQKVLQMTVTEVNRLNTLVNNILVSAQLEAGRHRVSDEELDFSDLVKTSFSDFQQRFPDRTWELDVEAEIDLKGDPLLLQILVNNLLENAMKYSPKDKRIFCKLHQHGKQVILEVIDEGPGIPDAEKKKVFEKFYRIGNENTRTAKGTGLGLYLCHKIAKDHHGNIRLTDNTPTGCTFSVSFNK
ncbi:ATP-binding protein [Paraflavitalea sp. CAU 1676]|uniref:sensor histidine kinase n=1 Tax=Paraflavitalea sp. CAU 1676 TaxID=3032598 RepID=UPI0023DA2B83|nr:ATP-binding protein [Paraflavitalea sp. CAU 1676]MDF2190755.1 ATP-binding protein [Paraflavitalea sp. CAU 1676]